MKLVNIAILTVAAVFFSLVVLFYSEDIREEVYGMIFIFPLIYIAFVSFQLTKQFRKAQHFCNGNLALFLSTVSLIVAEVLWLVMPHMGMPQYPAWPDIGYGMYFVFGSLMFWYLIRHYKVELGRKHIGIGILIIMSSTLSYLSITGIHVHNIEWITGLGFSLLTGFLLASSILAIITLRTTLIYNVVFLIGIAFLINSVTDILYYSMEVTSDWNGSNPMNIPWFISSLIIIYALTEIKQKCSLRREASNIGK